MKREVCEQLLTESEMACTKMGVDLYAIMKKAPLIVERWKPYYLTAQTVWANATSREDAIKFLSPSPDLDPVEVDGILAFVRSVPYFLRGALKEAVKDLPPPPGGRPHGLNPDEQWEVCKRIGELYAEGVPLAEAKKRMAQRFKVSLSTIQRVWQSRAKIRQYSSS